MIRILKTLKQVDLISGFRVNHTLALVICCFLIGMNCDHPNAQFGDVQGPFYAFNVNFK